VAKNLNPLSQQTEKLHKFILPMLKLRFRQIHLDFHISPHISSMGTQTNKKK